MTVFLVGCPAPEGGNGKDGPLDATGHWSGSCAQIGGLTLDLTDDDGAVTGSVAESTGATSDMVATGTRTDAELTLEVTYEGSDELLGTFALTLDGDALDGEYVYPGEASGYACAFTR
jgi:hypothetical protein